MIIGIDASRANREHKSGTEWYSYYLIKYFARLDADNQYVLYSDRPFRGGLLDLSKDDFSDDSEDVPPQFDKNGYQIIKSPHNNFKGKILRWPFSCFWTLGRLSWEMIIARPKVLFVPAHGLPLIHPKRTISTIHDVSFRQNGASGLYEKNKISPIGNRSVSRLFNFFVRLATFGRYSANSFDYLDWSTSFALKKAEKIITVSDSSRAEILKFYNGAAEKIKVIYNGFNESLYQKITDQEKISEVLRQHGISQPYLLYVGRLEKKKNTPLLIEAFAKVKYRYKDVAEKLVLVGDPSFGYHDAKYIIKEYELNEEVIMPGWIEEVNMPYIFSGASAFVFPSQHEGFGIPILQAMNCGLPVIASDIPVLREVAGQAALFFNPSSKDDLAQAIYKITADYKLRGDLIARGLERAKNFSWEKCARETLKIILEE